MADAPAASTTLAISIALILLSSQPLLIFTVTGILTAFTTASTISFTLAGFFKRALPACDFIATLGTGHPMFISIISGFISFSTSFAALINEFLSLPNIC